MPFYEYECPHCGHHEEALQKVTDKPLKKCPNCGKNGLRKLMSAPVFRLKGSGWYETDFKTDKDKQRNLVDSEKGESKSDAKSDTKVEAKVEAKAETKSEPKEAAKPADAKPARKPAAKPVKAARPAKKKARR